MDTATVSRIAKLHPDVREEVASLIEKVNSALTGRASIRITQGLRTIEEQNALYKLGRTVVNPDGKSEKKPFGNKVTNAKGGQSYHNYGVAIDFVLIIDGKDASWDINKDWDDDQVADWIEVVKIFKAAGWEWGGNWTSLKDYPHFQKTFGNSISDLIKKYKQGYFLPDSTYVNLQ